jgi:hypothetical protein
MEPMDRHDVDLFNDPDFLRKLRKILEKGHSFKLIFHGIEKEYVKQADIVKALAEAKEDFITNCPKIADLKREFPTGVHICWTPLRLHDHCIVIGDRVALREKTQHSQDEYPELTVLKGKKLIKAWEGYAEKLISLGCVKEIDFGETSPVVEGVA